MQQIILARLTHLEDTLEKFQHSVGHSLSVIDNDLYRLETRLGWLERNTAKPHQTRRSVSTSSSECLMMFSCSGTFDSLKDGVLCIGAVCTELLFIGTGAGTLEVWQMSREPKHLETICLADVVDGSSSRSAASLRLNAQCLVAGGQSRLYTELFVGLSDGRICVFKVVCNTSSSASVKIAFAQVWPEKSFVSSGLHLHGSSTKAFFNDIVEALVEPPFTCLSVSADKTMLAAAKGSDLYIFSVNGQGIQAVTFKYAFSAEDNNADTMAGTPGDDVLTAVGSYSRSNSRNTKHNINNIGFNEHIQAITFDEDSGLLFCAIGSRCINVFMKQCRETHITWHKSRSLHLPMEPSSVTVTSLLVAAGNRLIFAGGSNGKLYIFQRATAQHYRRGTPASSFEFSYSLLGHTAAVSCIVSVGSSYPLCVLTGSQDSTIRVWHWHASDREMVAAQVLDRHRLDIKGLVIMSCNNDSSTAGCRLFSASLDNSVKSWIPSATLRSSMTGSVCPDSCDSDEGSTCDECAR